MIPQVLNIEQHVCQILCRDQNYFFFLTSLNFIIHAGNQNTKKQITVDKSSATWFFNIHTQIICFLLCFFQRTVQIIHSWVLQLNATLMRVMLEIYNVQIWLLSTEKMITCGRQVHNARACCRKVKRQITFAPNAIVVLFNHLPKELTTLMQNKPLCRYVMYAMLARTLFIPLKIYFSLIHSFLFEVTTLVTYLILTLTF